LLASDRLGSRVNTLRPFQTTNALGTTRFTLAATPESLFAWIRLWERLYAALAPVAQIIAA
jgi:hypothetical protein